MIPGREGSLSLKPKRALMVKLKLTWRMLLKQWKPRTKLGDVMGILNQRAIEVSEKVRPVPEIRTGDIVEIKLILAQHKGDKSRESEESEESKALLPEGQTSSSLHF
ncbi:Ribosomal protein L19 protein [Raphanus sativus]|nr:Ribosomal protein L19 protein [Raphanus sativus]